MIIKREEDTKMRGFIYTLIMAVSVCVSHFSLGVDDFFFIDNA